LRLKLKADKSIIAQTLICELTLSVDVCVSNQYRVTSVTMPKCTDFSELTGSGGKSGQPNRQCTLNCIDCRKLS